MIKFTGLHRDLKINPAKFGEKHFTRRINRNKCEKVIKMQSVQDAGASFYFSSDMILKVMNILASVFALLTFNDFNTVKYESCETLSLIN